MKQPVIAVCGYGLDEGVETGAVINAESKARIEKLIGVAETEGATVLVDGREKTVSGYENGTYVFPTLLDNVPPQGEIARTEIFGPVLQHDARGHIGRRHRDGKRPCLWQHGVYLYRQRAQQRVNSAQKPMREISASTSGLPRLWRSSPSAAGADSFFGDLHGQAEHAVEFFTETKVVVERWPREWSRKF